MAQSYYDAGEYEKCIEAVNNYEDLKIDTFRKNHELAKALPMVIDSAEQTMSQKGYIEEANKCCDLILDNITDKDWDLRYFVAMTYTDIAVKTGDKEYYVKAYEELKENTNYMVDEQRDKNNEYLAKLSDIEAKKEDGETDKQKDERKQYNKWLKEERKTALAPVYEPLAMNLDLLFFVADQLEISDSEKEEIHSILYLKDQPLFLVRQLEDEYVNRWSEPDDEADLPKIEFDGEKITIPVSFLENGSTIQVTVENGNETNVYTDFKMENLKRKTEGDINTFTAEYRSGNASDQKYTKDSKVTVEILPPESSYYDPISFDMEQTSYRKLAFVTFVNFEQAD